MQTTKLMLVEVASLVVGGGVLDVSREPFAELVVRVEERGHDEMEESPEFCENRKICKVSVESEANKKEERGERTNRASSSEREFP